MHIQLSYMYRDGSNYKKHGSVVFSNTTNITPEVIKDIVTSNLIDGEYFIAEDWDLPSLFFEDKNEDDHQWHEFVSLEITNEEVYSCDIGELLNKIAKVKA